ncbi:MAG: GNAT family N-acetyltransferase [Candidatus Hodarchaeales archaeon]|jgi:ribosomal protein S18 acetylase RimI-like enzyme
MSNLQDDELHILFPTMKHVREVNHTIHEAEKLAKCFTSFDKDDVWPGGFTRGVEFTAEYILKNIIKRQKNIAKFVIEELDQDKGFIGYCNLAETIDNDAYYIPLLGANPDYHGKGFGKTLLLSALKRTIMNGKRRLDLHTWPGNLKAVPLYKKVGFFWQPDTQVLMTNYLPAVLSCELLQDFFSRYNWYDSRELTITQTEDIHEENGQRIYRYTFNQDNESVMATIDREAKELSGVKLTSRLYNLDFRLKVTPNVGFKALDVPKFTLTMKNLGENPICIKINIVLREGVKIVSDELDSVNNKELSMNLNEEKVISGLLELDADLPAYDAETFSQTRTEARFQIKLRVDNKELLLGAGIRLQDAFIIKNQFKHLLPESKGAIITCVNKLPRTFSGKLNISIEDDLLHSQDLEIKESLPLDINIQIPKQFRKKTQIIPSKLSFKENGKELIITHQIPYFDEDSSLIYPENHFYILENRHIRFKLRVRPNIAGDSIILKESNLRLNAWRSMLALGTSSGGFPDVSSEFWVEPIDMEIVVDQSKAQLRIIKKSVTEYPGLVAVSIFEIRSGDYFVKFSYNLSSDTSDYTDMQILTTTRGNWENPSYGTGFVPTNEGLIELKDYHITYRDYFPDNADFFTENWWAFEHASTCYGVVWDDTFEKIEMYRANPPRLKTSAFDVKRGGSYQSPSYRLIITPGSYDVIRQIYANEIFGKTIDKLPKISPKAPIWIESVIFDSPSDLPAVPVKKTSSEIKVKAIHKSEMNYSLLVKAGEQTWEKNVDLSRKKSFVVDLDGDYQEYLPINAVIDNGLFKKELKSVIPFPLGKCELKNIKKESFNVKLFKNKTISAQIAPDFHGCLISFKYKGKELIWSRFPNSGPYIYFEKLPAGGMPLLFSSGGWNFAKALSVKYLSSEERIGDWLGVKLIANPTWDKKLIGMQINVTYWVHDGLPIMLIDLESFNTNLGSRHITYYYSISLNPNASSIAPIYRNELLKLPASEVMYSHQSNKRTPWIIIDQGANYPFLGIYHITPGEEIGLWDAGKQYTALEVISNETVKPKSWFKKRLLLLPSSNIEVLKSMASILYRIESPIVE